MAVQVFIALGANMAHPAKQLRRAIALVCLLPGTRLVQSSSFYSTAPQGYADQPDFINAVIEIATTLAAHELLEALLAIESALGRERKIVNGPRVIDLDLLLYGNDVIDKGGLQVPHPRMHERAFVMLPLAEMAPDTLVGGHGRAADIAAALDAAGVQRLP